MAMTTSDKAKTYVKQHTAPCHDCPWRRSSIKSWLGGATADQWLAAVHSDQRIECHTRLPHQCAGAAVFRANVCKSPRDKTALRLPSNEVAVFSTDQQFRDHHKE